MKKLPAAECLRRYPFRYNDFGNQAPQQSCSHTQLSRVQARDAQASLQKTRLPRCSALIMSTVQLQLAQAHLIRREERAEDSEPAFLVVFAMTASFRRQYSWAKRFRQTVYAAEAPR
jgi:hypothetical protein